ncbi:hypothetical protein [Prauserella flavalba]|uniref:hypothetical protein n=1 Tax=Prauserella flavalba TaxID=1477506 RepID=UPI0011B58CBF|nr:hypothetical protein [Prauserella flavalba]
MLEQLAEVALDSARTRPKARFATEQEIDTLRSQLAGVEGRWAYYLQLAESTAQLKPDDRSLTSPRPAAPRRPRPCARAPGCGSSPSGPERTRAPAAPSRSA